MTLVRPGPSPAAEVRRGATAAGLEGSGVYVEAFGGIGDEVEESVDTVGVALAHDLCDVGVTL
jgi:hypothetical protein